jgi:hypothetical protein
MPRAGYLLRTTSGRCGTRHPRVDRAWSLLSRPRRSPPKSVLTQSDGDAASSHLEHKFVTLYDRSNLYRGERLWRMQV